VPERIVSMSSAVVMWGGMAPLETSRSWVVLLSVAQDAQCLENRLFEFGERGELDAESEASVVRWRSVPHRSVELHIHGQAERRRLEGDMASHELETERMMEQDPGPEFRDI
jgi:hypothetical protein